jgi:hypothetical protein
MTTDLEKSFKAKLRNIAKETNRNPADLWQSIVLERFLIRLGQSHYRRHFVLKGGVLLAKYIPIGRETQDLDLLGINTSFEESVSLLCYPPEFIFAEKLETLVYRGNTNSRMKDFHDLYTMLNLSNLSHEDLKAVVPFVFQHRQTPFSLPLKFSDTDISLLQVHWSNYRTRLHQNDARILPINISECISLLNSKLTIIMDKNSNQ